MGIDPRHAGVPDSVLFPQFRDLMLQPLVLRLQADEIVHAVDCPASPVDSGVRGERANVQHGRADASRPAFR